MAQDVKASHPSSREPNPRTSGSGPDLWASRPIHGSNLPGAALINPRILEAFNRLTEADFTRRTHFFGGRYENLYLELTRIPELAPVLAHAESCAREILGLGNAPLRSGFWLNAQGPGQSTTEHSHDENDELLSGVYYVSAPQDSGDLVLADGHLKVVVTPKPGMLLFFPPDLPHRVETNRSPNHRLSIAFNFGPATGSDE